MITVKLSPELYDKAMGLANHRYQISKASKFINQKQDILRSEMDIERIGTAGEFAVAELYNLDHPLPSGYDNGHDLWFYGKSLQVKTSFYEKCKLIFKDKQKFVSDFAILVYQDTQQKEKLSIVGATSRKYFIEFAKKENLGNGDVYTLEQNQMAEPQEFWKYIMNTRYKEISK